MLEATGLQLPLGATCLIERHNGGEVQEVESEVVGFNGQHLFLMPLEDVEGIVPGARVYARVTTSGTSASKQSISSKQSIPSKQSFASKQLPLGPDYWAGYWMAVPNRLMAYRHLKPVIVHH